MDSAIRREFVSRQTIKLAKGDYPLNIFTVRVNDPRTVSEIFGGYSWFTALYRLTNNLWVSVGATEKLTPGTYWITNCSNLSEEVEIVLEGPEDITKNVSADFIGLLTARTKTIDIRAWTIESRMLSDSGTGTLNDANPSATIVPDSLPTKIHLIFDISNLNNAGDDFTLEVKVGVSGSERVVAYYKLTSDGTDITCDTGSGTGNVIKQRRIDISDILVYNNEQVVVSRTKNSATDRDVEYKYVCGI